MVEGCPLVLFLLSLSYISYRDLKDRMIPDRMIVICFMLGILWRFAGDRSLLEGVIGASVLFCLSLGSSWAYLKMRGRIGLGGGDIKLLAVAGLWLAGISFRGVSDLPWIFLFVGLCCFAQVLFSLIRRKVSPDPEIPFGPVLCGGMALSLILAG